MTEISDLNPNLLSDPNPISIPPLDPLFLSDPMSDLDFLLDDNNGDFTDFDFTLDDFDFDNLDANPIVNPSEEERSDSVHTNHSDSVHSQVSSQGSKTLISSSPDSSNPSKSSLTKRKKESGDECISVKYQKSESIEDDDDKKKVRLIRNRESAQLSRLRKKQYVEELQGKVKSMNSTIAELNHKISYVIAENVALKQQMAVASGAPPPPMMNPYMVGPPLPYQWMPYPVRGYGGSMTPLVPIPKLNPKQSCRPKKSEGKSKVKKVASVSFIGVLFFVFLFSTLVPFMNVGESGGLSSYKGPSRYYDEHKGRVLMVGDGGSDVRREREISEGNVRTSRRDSCGGVGYNGRPEVEGGSSALRNASDPLFASLYVPRNDGLVKIDGNLIIHSVLASEKAMATEKKSKSETVKSKEPGLTIPDAPSSALAVPEVRGNGELLLHSPEGKRLHQWFHEGGSGTLMDYSMCTEVFQFDVAPGAIVPSSVSNITREHLQNVTTGVKRMKNRRTLQGLPVSLVPSELNITDTDPSKDTQNKSFSGNTNNKPKSSSSSMVVSVLLDPREIVDPESDRVIPPNPKSLSRIFVVVLLDSVKYVTYSCVLPRSGLHLVTT